MSAVWKKLFSSEDQTNFVDAITTFGGELYVGASRSVTNKAAFVYRLTQDGCKKWQDVTPLWSPATENIGGLVVFNGQLYVGNDQGEIFRTSNGVPWENVTGNFPKVEIAAMHEFNNHLYVATPGSVYRSSDGKSWTLVGENFTSAETAVINSLEEFEKYLYVGIGLDDDNGIRLWRTDGSNNGKNWVLFKKLVKYDPEDYFPPGHLHALKTFKLKKELYVGRYHGKGVWYTDGLTKPDGTALNWNYSGPIIPSGDVFRLEEHNGKLYLGVSHFIYGTSGSYPLLFESTDGRNWNVSPVSPYSSLTNDSICALYSSGNRLYVGFGAMANDGSAEVWELGPPIIADAYEPNNNFDDATKVDLGSDPEKAAEFTDLTLHDGDVDFFEIKFESQQGECFSSFKKEVGAGIVAETYPGNIAISVKEEYCNDLFFEVYDADKNLVGTFKNEAAFTCPIQKFNGEKLFVVVKSLPAGSLPVRYNLYIRQNGWRVTLGRPVFEIGEFRKPIHLAGPFEFVSRIAKGTLWYTDANDLIKDVERYLPEFFEYRGAIDKTYLKYGLGYIAHKIGRLDEAERFYRSSLSSFEELGMAFREADVLHNLGELLAAQGKMKEAIELLERASQLHERTEDDSGLSQDRVALGRCYLIKGDAAKSLDTLKGALDLQKQISDWSGSALNLLYQAEAFMTLKEQEAAVACLILVEDFSSRISDPEEYEGINRRLRGLHESMATDFGERKFLELEKSLAGQANKVWHRAISQIRQK